MAGGAFPWRLEAASHLRPKTIRAVPPVSVYGAGSRSRTRNPSLYQRAEGLLLTVGEKQPSFRRKIQSTRFSFFLFSLAYARTFW